MNSCLWIYDSMTMNIHKISIILADFQQGFFSQPFQITFPARRVTKLVGKVPQLPSLVNTWEIWRGRFFWEVYANCHMLNSFMCACWFLHPFRYGNQVIESYLITKAQLWMLTAPNKSRSAVSESNASCAGPSLFLLLKPRPIWKLRIISNSSGSKNL